VPGIGRYREVPDWPGWGASQRRRASAGDELSYLDDLRQELRAHLAGLREAFEGNLAYWATDL
jgi:hypothetical protein